MGLRSYPHVFFEMLIIGFSLIMGIGLTRAFLPIMAYGLDPTGTLVGFVTSAWFFTRAFIELPSGLIAIKVGRRNLIVRGLLLSIIGPLICAFSINIYMLILGMTIWGFGTALYFTSNTALIFDLFKPERRGRAVGTFQSIEFMGFFLGAPLGAILAGFLGFNNIFILTSLLVLLAFLIAFFSRGLKRADLYAQNEVGGLTMKDALAGLKSWGLIAVSFINLSRMLVSQGIMSTVFPLYLNEELKISVELIGLVMGARTGGMICATLMSGHLSDRLGRKPLIIGGLLIGGVSLYLYTVTTAFVEILLLATLDGVGSGFTFVSLIVFMSELVSPSIRMGAVGLYRTFMDIGGILGPIIFMLLYTMVNEYTPFWIASLLFLFNLAVAFLIKRRE